MPRTRIWPVIVCRFADRNISGVCPGLCSTDLMSALMCRLRHCWKCWAVKRAKPMPSLLRGSARRPRCIWRGKIASMHILTAMRFISNHSSQCRPEPARPHCRSEKIESAGFYRILRVARTLADLDHRDMPSPEKVVIAIRWRDIAFLHAGRRSKNYVIRPSQN